MTNITCTNCNYTFEVDKQFYESKDMIFNCDNCGTEIKKNNSTGDWEAKSKPITKKTPEQVNQSFEVKKGLPKTIQEKLQILRGVIIICGALYSLGGLIILGVARDAMPGMGILGVGIHLATLWFSIIVFNILLEALSKHLENQEKIISTLEQKSHNN